jgi:DNA-binding transcriptional ArsR family regulator
MNDSHQPWQEKNVKHLWFHVVSESLQNGLIKKIGAVPWAVYCVIKSHAGLDTGNAWPSNARLAELIGVSHDTVQRAMKTLVEAGLINVVKKQRGNVNLYSITETIKVDEKDGTPWAVGERKYIPTGFGDCAPVKALR